MSDGSNSIRPIKWVITAALSVILGVGGVAIVRLLSSDTAADPAPAPAAESAPEVVEVAPVVEPPVGESNPPAAALITLFVGDLTCETASFDWDTSITCANGGADAVINWGDGSSEAIAAGASAEHRFASLGAVSIGLEGADSLDLVLTPDLEVTCSVGSTLPIYDIAPVDKAANGGQPWDYIYAHPDGSILSPGDEGYRPDIFGSDWTLIQVGEGESTGSCEVASRALDLFGGEVTWSTNHFLATNDTLTGTTFSAFRRGTWRGVQEGSLTVTLHVGETYITQYRNVYFRGCG